MPVASDPLWKILGYAAPAEAWLARKARIALDAVAQSAGDIANMAGNATSGGSLLDIAHEVAPNYVLRPQDVGTAVKAASSRVAPKNLSKGEKVFHSAIEGAVPGALTGGAGIVPAAIGALSGGAGNAASEIAEQHGASPLVSSLIGLGTGAVPFAAAGGVGRLARLARGEETAPMADDMSDLEHVLNAPVREEPFTYNEPQQFGELHPADKVTRPIPDDFAVGKGMNERQAEQARKRFWLEKQAQEEAAQKAAPPEGVPDTLTFDNGKTADIHVLDDAALKARLAERQGAPVEEPPVHVFADDIDLNTPPAAANDDAGSAIFMDRPPLVDETPEGDATHFAGRSSVSHMADDEPPVAANDTEVSPLEPPAGGREPPNEPPSGGGEPPSEPPPPSDPEEVISRLTGALTRAKKLLPEQRAMYRQARQERLKQVGQARAMGSGEEGFNAELGALKGELPKKDFDDLRGQFSQDDINALFEHVKNSPNLGWFESLHARQGLRNILEGRLPNASQLALLGKAFPKDFLKAALSKRSLMSKITDAAGNVLNIPRALKSSIDLSAPFRQGLFLVNRPEFWKAFKPMLKSFGSESAYKDVMADIANRPTANMMGAAKLFIAKEDHVLGNREEAFMSNWAEKIPGIGRAVRASDRAYTTFLNKLRADTFDSILKDAADAGYPIDDEFLEGLGKFVNHATGRGSFGKRADQAGPLLNSIFFSPRLVASRIQLMNPAFYAQLPEPVRKEALKSLASLGTLATTVLGLAAAGGLAVEANPLSSNFGKIRSGDTRYDILGGFAQPITLGARLAMNETKTQKGEIKKFGGPGPFDPTRGSTLARFARSKLSPLAGAAVDWSLGENYIGEPFDAKQEALGLMTPMTPSDIYDSMKSNGPIKGIAMASPSIVGFGVNTYDDMPPPPASIRVNGQDIHLPKAARDQYEATAKSYVNAMIQLQKEHGEWDNYSKEDQQMIKSQLIKDGRARAKAQLLGEE